MKTIKEQILTYAKKTYKTVPDTPFRTAPTYLALRHTDTRKWYALFMDVPREKLGLPGSECVDILNVKCDPVLSGLLRGTPGYLPAYHMHRETWITILLDGTVSAKDIYPLLDMSYELTRKKSKPNSQKEKSVGKRDRMEDENEPGSHHGKHTEQHSDSGISDPVF